MIQVAPFLFGIALDIRTLKPRAFSQHRLEQILTGLVDTELGLALKGDQIRVRNTDSAFDYELKASLLGANGVFVYDAEKSLLSISGGRTQTDARVLAETAKRFLWASEVGAQDIGTLSVNTHARAQSNDARNAFLRAFGDDERIIAPGRLGYVKTPAWDQDVRFSVEQSIGVPDSLFIALSTQFRGAEWISAAEDLIKMLESVAAVFSIEFKPLGEV